MDQNTDPVVGATVTMKAVDNPSERSSAYERRTDEQGLFSITGVRGAALSVFVSKEGYYVTNSHGPFRYVSRAVDDPPLPTRDNPVVFTLFKRGEAEPLLHSESCIMLPSNGTPVQMSLRRSIWRKAPAPPWDIQLEYSMQNQNNEAPPSSYEWRLRISVPNGGLIKRTDALGFMAPMEGYQESDEIHMSVNAARWRPTATREYFVRLASGAYGRFSLRINTGNENYVLVESFINPSGSQNLEYDPQKKLRPSPH